MACDLYREGTLLRCGKMKLTMLNFDLVGGVRSRMIRLEARVKLYTESLNQFHPDQNLLSPCFEVRHSCLCSTLPQARESVGI